MRTKVLASPKDSDDLFIYTKALRTNNTLKCLFSHKYLRFGKPKDLIQRSESIYLTPSWNGATLTAVFSEESAEIERNCRWKSVLFRLLIQFGLLFVHTLIFGSIALLLFLFEYIGERHIHSLLVK